MTNLLRALTIGLSLMTAAAYAQDATTAPAADATPPAGDAAAASDLSMGASTTPGLPTQADAAVGKTYLAASFDKWDQRCVKKADGSDPCQLYQLLKDSDGNDVAEISIFSLPDGSKAAAGATFMAPLETLLTAALKISIDAKAPKVYPFSFCTRVGCVSRLGFTADEVAALKKGVKATLSIVPAAAPDKVVELELTLKGFTAGYEAVKTANTKK